MNINHLYSRKILDNILNWINDPQILLLIGSRQVGKTCLLHLIIDSLKKTNIPQNTIHFFDLTIPNNLNNLNSFDRFIELLKSKDVDFTNRNYIFIDEIQYLDDPTTFLKIIADHYPSLKIIATGSSTLEIKQKFKDALTGRKKVFEIHSLDFQEFLIFKEQCDLAKAIKENSLKNTILINENPNITKLEFLSHQLIPLYNEFVTYGGYPQITLETSHQKKSELLLEIYNSYIRKDIKDLVYIENINAFNNLIQALTFQIGQLVNYHELTNTLRLARNTLEKYIFLLENTFIIKMLPPYFSNKRKEIAKMNKVFFYDLGLRNIVITNFTDMSLRPDAPLIWENSLFSQLSKTLDPLIKLHYWRTLSKNEVDFIVVKDYILPLEVKYQPFKEPNIPSGIKSFIREYNPKNAIVVTRDYIGKGNYENTTIWFLPPWLIEI